MSRDFGRKDYYNREGERGREWRGRNDYRYDKDRPLTRKRSRSPPSRPVEKRASRSPRRSEDLLDENILNEISKLPEPSELWDDQNQNMQESGFSAPPPTTPFATEGTYTSNYQPSYSGIYDDFPSVASIPAPPPPEMSTWNQMSLPPPPTPPVYNIEDQIKKEAAIETEMRHQKAALSKQREDYIKKTAILKKELDTLKDQRNELRGDAKRSPSPDTKRFLKENTKLQLEIQNKLKTINNVVDMLNGIIGEQAPDLVEPDETPERSSKRKSRSPSASKKFNYVYYDPEMHWCRVCNEFPPTAKDYLNHLHSPAHHKMAAQHMEAPWHSVTGVNEGFPSFPSAPTKRTPIRGLQFFVPSTAWYCKLCDQFIGDLHCASAHLKSLIHSRNYTNFVEQNPHWETDWMSDRQKAFETARASTKTVVKLEEKPQYAAHTITFNKDGFHTKRKVESPPPSTEPKKKKEKKKSKRKRSSSSSSSSSSSASDSEPRKKKKKNKKNKSAEKLTEWMSSIQMDHLNDRDRKLLDNIKTRIRQDKEDKRRVNIPVIDLCHTRDRESRTREDRDSRGRPRSRDRQDRNSRTRDRNSRARDSRARDDRDKREIDPRRRDDHRDDRGDDRMDDGGDEDRSPARSETKKVDSVRKMPFIGKMPVFKSLTKNTKTEDNKKDEKKKEDEESKKRQEIDAEIQKKVAEFKEKIAKAQLERQQVDLPPPQLILPMPTHFMPPAPAPAPPAPPPPVSTPQPPAPALPKDFQEALDIIFPSADQHSEMGTQEMFSGIPGLGAGFPGMPGLMNPFPQLSILGQPPPHMMMGFDMNNSMFGPRPQLYDTHVPLVPKPHPRQNKNKHNNQNLRIIQNKHFHNKNNNAHNTNNNVNNRNINANNRNNNANNRNNNAAQLNTTTAKTTSETKTTNATKTAVATAAAKQKEELDDLAMLGIDASDVGAGI